MISARFTYDGGHSFHRYAGLEVDASFWSENASLVRRDRGLHTISARSTYDLGEVDL